MRMRAHVLAVKSRLDREMPLALVFRDGGVDAEYRDRADPYMDLADLVSALSLTLLDLDRPEEWSQLPDDPNGEGYVLVIPPTRKLVLVPSTSRMCPGLLEPRGETARDRKSTQPRVRPTKK